MGNMQIDVTGLDGVMTRLSAIERRMADLAPAFDAIEPLLMRSISRNFDAGGRPGWAPRKKDVPWPPLQRTGALRQSATSGIDRRQALGIGASVLELAATLSYAKYQQFGTYSKGHPKGITPRPFVVFQSEDVPALTRIILLWVLLGQT